MFPNSICRLAKSITLRTPTICCVIPIAQITAIGLWSPGFLRLRIAVHRDPGNLRYFFWRITQDGCLKLFESFRPVLNEFLILPVVLQDDVHQPIDQGDIGTRAMAQVKRGEFCDINLRGSATTSLVWRFNTAWRIMLPNTGCCSVVLEPIMSIACACWATSSIELDIAPDPKEAARPATVLECQRRAQWSMLFVPITWRANLFIR